MITSYTVFTASWFNSYNSLLFSFEKEETEAQKAEVNIHKAINWDSNPGHWSLAIPSCAPQPTEGSNREQRAHLPPGYTAQQLGLAPEQPLAGQLPLFLHPALLLQLLELQVLKELGLCLQGLSLL